VPLIPVIRLGEIEIDIFNRVVRAGDSVVHLSGIDQSLPYFLASRGGRVITRDEILDAIWAWTSSRRATSSTATSGACAQDPERLPQSALHRHRPRHWLPIHPDLLQPGMGRRVDHGRARRELSAAC